MTEQNTPPPPQDPAPAAAPAAAPSAASKEANSKKVAAGICGILLGWLGIHKFILGYTTEGVIMLLIGTIGSIITLGLAGFAIGIIGLIEGIIYLTKTDDEFQSTYMANKKGWF